MKLYNNIISIILSGVLSCLMASCRDDDLGFSGDDYRDGITTVSLEMAFDPFVAQNLSRATDDIPTTGFNTLSDMVILIYDKDGNLLPGDSGVAKIDIASGILSNDPRTGTDTDGKNPNTSDGSTSVEDKTLSLKNISLKLPFGEYYIVAVANLGEYKEENNKIETVKTTYDVLNATYKGQYDTLDGLRKMKVNWNDSDLSNNRALLGYFVDNTNSDALPKSPDYQSTFSTVKINRPGIKLAAWLRRCVSKITVDFDAQQLRENVYIRIKDVKICDITTSCTVGFGQLKDNSEADNTIYNNTAGDEDAIMNSDQRISYGNEDPTTWPELTKGHPFISYNGTQFVKSETKGDLHSQSMPALYFYENMQGIHTDTDRTMYPDIDNGGVDGATGKKPESLKYGTYIEVEAEYHSDADDNIADGPIYYRFLLGKDVTTNYNAERNFHYKLTLVIRGNGNDYDWQVDFVDGAGFDVPNPWYVSYVYNHDATMPFKFTAPEGYELDYIEAEILTNPWYPSVLEEKDQKNGDVDIKPTIPADEKSAASPYSEEPFNNNSNNANGFLSLMVNENDEEPALSDMVALGRKFENTSDYPAINTCLNEAFYLGKRDGLDRSKRKYYPNYLSDKDNAQNSRNAYTCKTDNNNYSFSIPLHTRQKVLIKETGYSGNNPFVGYERTAKLQLTAYLKPKDGTVEEHKPIVTKVNVIQVRRIVNPKGVYRRANNSQPFKVKMMWLDGGKKGFTPVESRGPWVAEIVGDKNFITLDGKQRVTGSTGSNIEFNINFNRMSTGSGVRNAIVRIRYHNYTCIHLIFVRQGYDAQEIRPGGTKWETRNMIAQNLMANDPRDEGSLFKFGNSSQPIDAYNNAYKDSDGNEYYTTPADDQFASSGGSFYTVDDEGNLSESTVEWKDISKNDAGFSGGLMENVATMADIEALYWNGKDNINYVEFGYGVLYADGATETKTDINDAYGYYRRDPDNSESNGTDSEKGMRGVFVYYYNNKEDDNFNGRNMFFPIGRSGFGHRKDIYEGDETTDPDNNHKGILRYSAGRYKASDKYTQKTSWGTKNMGIYFPYTAPLFVSMYIRNGAIYWAKQKTRPYITWNGEPRDKDNEEGFGLDLNYFTFDVNGIPGADVNQGESAAFVRTVKRSSQT